MNPAILLAALLAMSSGPARAAGAPLGPAPAKMRPQLTNNIARPLRYFPAGTDFVITNGAEWFNRPLYGTGSGFRVDGGDRPEFSLYLPGRGGNLRLGIRTREGVKWLDDADQIVARYRPGSLLYEIRDSLLGDGELDLAVLPLSEPKGLVARAELRDVKTPVELVCAFGGANGMRGRRGGDIGCERVPVGEFFKLRADECRGDEFTIASNTFVLRGKSVAIAGVFPTDSKVAVADATKWNSAAELLASAGAKAELPVVIGRGEMRNNGPVFLALAQVAAGPKVFSEGDLPELFSAAEERRRAIAEQVVVETPDAFIDAAVPALNIAADAIWDGEQQSFMHGAVAWRTRLLGWRGPYAGDALGRPERTAAHFAGFAREQNTNPIPAAIPPAAENFNLARNETALHSNGDLTKSHYDMNLVAVDAFFRHLLWTGDLDYARQMWPVIERHFAWEQRLFRRGFGPDKLPLYEAYAAIWASDDLNYNGAGTAHASAYNFFANKTAARVAKLIGKDPTPYEREADLILRAMQKYLWLTNDGCFAECKDYLGLQLTHDSPALWTFYTTMDSGVPVPVEAWRMSRWVDAHLARFPVRGRNVPGENLFTLSDSNWLPYQWSLNNVVMAEAAHASLAYWQANRPEPAFQLFKGELLTSMFLGRCPGNLGAMTTFDAARGEAQRDFGDAIGINARALVEGLFGVKPDALAGELKIVPGFPADWTHASIRHPDFNFSFRRDGLTEVFSIEPKFPKPMSLCLQIPALRSEVAGLTNNGRPVKWRWIEGEIGRPRVEITSPASARFAVVVTWKGKIPSAKIPPESVSAKPPPGPAFDWGRRFPAGAKFETVDLAPFFNDRVTQLFRNEYRTPRSSFCSLATPKQGIGGWCEPDASFDVDDSGLRATAAEHGGKITMPDGVPFQTPAAAGATNIVFTSQWDNYPREVSVPLSGMSPHAFLLMAGSSGAMQSRLANGEVVAAYADGSSATLRLRNPENWWPVDQDYFTDDFAFRLEAPLPPRLDLASGKIRVLDAGEFKGKGGVVPGGAATVLELPLDQNRELKSLTVRALANEVVIGLMSVTLERE